MTCINFSHGTSKGKQNDDTNQTDQQPWNGLESVTKDCVQEQKRDVWNHGSHGHVWAPIWINGTSASDCRGVIGRLQAFGTCKLVGPIFVDGNEEIPWQKCSNTQPSKDDVDQVQLVQRRVDLLRGHGQYLLEN